MNHKEQHQIPQLTEGHHGTKREIQFVYDVISNIIRPSGYIGPITLIGSRSEGKWISKSNYLAACEDLDRELQQFWYRYLDHEAHIRNYSRAEIPQLVDILPPEAPTEIKTFLTSPEPPGSDFDLFLHTSLPWGISKHDYTFGTKQSIDILSSGDGLYPPDPYTKLS